MKNLLLSALVAALVAGGFLLFGGGDLLGSGNITFFQTPSFLQGIRVGTARQFTLANDGVLTTSGAANFDGAADFDGAVDISGEVTLGKCSTKSWNPGAVVSSTVATTSLAMPTGYEAGDPLFFALATSTMGANDTAGLILRVGPPVAASGTEVIAQLSASGEQMVSKNAATSTLTVCYINN